MSISVSLTIRLASVLLVFACVIPLDAVAQSAQSAQSARSVQPAQPAATRAPDVHFDPTPPNVVAEILRLAKVKPGDTVYDLGCGDGRIVIAAAKVAGARGVCVDIDPVRIRESRSNAAAAGVGERIKFLQGDLFTTDISDASVVVLFLWPDLNLKRRPRLWRELKPGTRVVSYVHDMGDWKPRETIQVQGSSGERTLYLWTIGVPARTAK